MKLIWSDIRPILVVAVLTWLGAFGYQLAFYGYYRLIGDGFLHYKTVFDYLSGLVGDGIILPILNVLVYLLLREMKVKLTWGKVGIFLVAGLVTTVLVHYTQASNDMVNWAMPEPFFWSGVGRFHFFFMWFEFSLLFLTLIETIRRTSEVYRSYRKGGLFALSWLSIGLFLLTFVMDYTNVITPAAVLAHWK